MRFINLPGNQKQDDHAEPAASIFDEHKYKHTPSYLEIVKKAKTFKKRKP